jgi:hypothetical protein
MENFYREPTVVSSPIERTNLMPVENNVVRHFFKDNDDSYCSLSSLLRIGMPIHPKMTTACKVFHPRAANFLSIPESPACHVFGLLFKGNQCFSEDLKSFTRSIYGRVFPPHLS